MLLTVIPNFKPLPYYNDDAEEHFELKSGQKV
jgi:hypothetical protein